MYKVHNSHVTLTELDSTEGDVQLSTNNMRSNPRIGIATVDIVSNLDPRIKPTVNIDISKLLTASAGIDEESLKVTEGILKSAVAGTSKYQVFTTQHTGSNFTGDWATRANAIAPTQGYTMPIHNWFN